MQETAEQLRRAIAATPDAVEARLIYADLLTARGDPLGAFMTAQIMLGQLSATDPRWPGLWGRSERLLARHHATWIADLKQRIAPQLRDERLGGFPYWRGGVRFRRGAIECVSLSDPTAIEIARRHVPVRAVRLARPPEAFDLPDLVLDRPLGSRNGVAFAALRWLHRLRSLSLDESRLGVLAARRLAAVHFERLEALSLRGAGVRDAGTLAISGAPWFTDLRRLDLSANGLTTDGLEALSEHPQIEALAIASNPKVAGRLSTLGQLSACHSLTVRSAWHAGDLGWLCRQLPGLTRLDITTPRRALSRRAIRQIGEALPTSLTHLSFGNTRAGAQLMPVLATLSPVTRVLDLRSNSLEDDAISTILRSRIEAPTRLDFNSNRLTDAAVIDLAQWPALRTVTHLNLGNNRRVKAAGLQALINAQDFDPVELDLYGLVGRGPLLEPLRARFGAALRCEHAPYG